MFYHSLSLFRHTEMSSSLTFVWIYDGREKAPASSEHPFLLLLKVSSTTQKEHCLPKGIPWCRDSYSSLQSFMLYFPLYNNLSNSMCIKIKFTGTGEMDQWVTHLSPSLMTWIICPLTYMDRTALPSYSLISTCIAKLFSDFYMRQHGIHIHTINTCYKMSLKGNKFIFET